MAEKLDQSGDSGKQMPPELRKMLRKTTDSSTHGLGLTHWILIGNTVVLAALVGGVVWFIQQLSRTPDGSEEQLATANKAVAQVAPVAPAPAAAKAHEGPLSLPQAQAAYAAGDFKRALDSFSALLTAARSHGSDNKTCDFLLLRVAQCRQAVAGNAAGPATNDPAQAAAFAELAASDSPAIRVMANYHLALIDAAHNRHLAGRMHAYAALACLDMVASRMPQSDKLRAQCDLLVAQALTAAGSADQPRYIVDGGLDPLAAADEKELHSLLDYGSDTMAKSVIGSRIEKAQSQPGGENAQGLKLWTIASLQAPLHELLQQCATLCECDVQLVDISPLASRRPVTMFSDGVTSQRLFETIAGAAGLIARFDGDKVTIHDPQAGASLATAGDLIRKEGISTWRRLLLRYPQDKRLAAGHLALGTLLEAGQDVGGAINEYQLTAARYAKEPLAPTALLRCARLKISVRDFVGARKDLLSVVDGYPDNPVTQDVYVELGESALNLGLGLEAFDSFKKAFEAQGPQSAKAQAALGAAKASAQMQKFEQAVKWAKQHLSLEGHARVEDRAHACMVLGQAEMAQGHVDAAAAAFVRGMASPGGAAAPAGPLHVALALELAQAQLVQKAYAAALGALQTLDEQTLTGQQRTQALLLKSQVLRGMGLAQQSLKLMSASLEEQFDADQKAELSLELANSCIAAGQNQQAYDILSATYPKLTGARHHKVACDLARLCVDMDKLPQATLLCNDVLKKATDPQIKRQAGEILAKVYIRQKQYDRAAVVLSASKAKDNE